MAIIKSTLIYFLITLASLILTNCADIDDFKIVNTENGPIRGQLLSTKVVKHPYYSFRGIPYAEPPIRELRFKAPQPLTYHWTEVKNAFKFGHACTQVSFTKKIFGSEDCLYLNVYVPANVSNEKLAVMIFIHGGSWITQSSNMYGPDLLMSQGVILVTFNYRLGPFGFLTLDLPEYSGNMGLKDQLAAIQWVNRNIEKFGGDKQNITIFGQSVGAASTQMHILSPASQGLFQRAIIQSGSVFCPWAFGSKDRQMNAMNDLGNGFGFNLSNPQLLLGFIRVVDPLILTGAVVKSVFISSPIERLAVATWGPVVEVANAIQPFLLEDPRDILMKNTTYNIDLLIGYNSAEMYFVTVPQYYQPHSLLAFNKTFAMTMPWRNWKHPYGSRVYNLAADEIRKYYIPGGKINKKTFWNYNQMLSDAYFVYGIETSAFHIAKRIVGKVYNYEFSLQTKLNLIKTILGQFPNFNLSGAAHEDDLFYLFLPNMAGINVTYLYSNITKNPMEKNLVQLMTGLWTNFAKFGTPTPFADEFDDVKFQPYLSNERNFVNITNNGLVRGVNPAKNTIQFWNSLYLKYVKGNSWRNGSKSETDPELMGKKPNNRRNTNKPKTSQKKKCKLGKRNIIKK